MWALAAKTAGCAEQSRMMSEFRLELHLYACIHKGFTSLPSLGMVERSSFGDLDAP